MNNYYDSENTLVAKAYSVNSIIMCTVHDILKLSIHNFN